ncbi:MAG TPA: hypothetical protein VJ939_05255 [Bacteroidales bacterium]|nr:hypothetical protein [Bacteroidales bacterium]
MSWKNILIIIAVIAAIVLLLGFLFTEGYINPKWQTLTIILGALAIPYQYLKNRFSSFNKKYDEIERLSDRADQRKADEQRHRESMDQKIRERELRLQLLEERISKIDTSIENLEMKQANVRKKVSAMDEDELKEAFEDLFKRKKH